MEKVVRNLASNVQAQRVPLRSARNFRIFVYAFRPRFTLNLSDYIEEL